MRRHLVTMTATTLLLAGTLAACGGDDADEKGTDSSSSSQTDEGSGGYPECGDVWVVGESLLEGYEGCDDGDTIMAAVSWDCEDGTQMTSYDDTFWAVGDQPIEEKRADEIADDEGYSQAFDDCHGF